MNRRRLTPAKGCKVSGRIKNVQPLTRVVPREFKPLVPSDNTLGMGGFLVYQERRWKFDLR